jgi:hypothetical protein
MSSIALGVFIRAGTKLIFIVVNAKEIADYRLRPP